MSPDQLGDPPEPKAEEPDLYPGGADSIEDEEKYGERLDEPTVPNLDPENNPAVEEQVPDEVTSPDDKQQEPEGEAAEQTSDSERSPAAGQEDESGNPEEPA